MERVNSLDSVLSELRACLPLLMSLGSIDAGARPYCDAIYELYRAFRGGLDSDSHQRVESFLTESTEAMSFSLEFLGGSLIQRMEAGFRTSFQGMEWLDLCALRSTIEALKELYADHLAVDALMPEEGDLDERLIAKGKAEAFMHPEITPSDFPTHHWWWSLE